MYVYVYMYTYAVEPSKLRKRVKRRGSLARPASQERMSRHSRFCARAYIYMYVRSSRFTRLTIYRFIDVHMYMYMHVYVYIYMRTRISGTYIYTYIHVDDS